MEEALVKKTEAANRMQKSWEEALIEMERERVRRGNFRSWEPANLGKTVVLLEEDDLTRMRKDMDRRAKEKWNKPVNVAILIRGCVREFPAAYFCFYSSHSLGSADFEDVYTLIRFNRHKI